MAKILITGGAGFIGSQLAHRLWTMGHDISIIDDMSYGKMDNMLFDDVDLTKFLTQHDISDATFMDIFMSKLKPDYVYNIAGIAPLPDNQLNPARAIEVNVKGLVNVLEASRKYGVRKIVQASTNAMYENVKMMPCDERMNLAPTLIYPNTKYCAEQFARSYCETYGMNVTCLRFANVYGPHVDCLRKQPPFVAYMIRELHYGRVPTFYSTGEQRRDYIYVDDLIDLAYAAITKPDTGFDIVNCSSNTNYSVRELFDLTKKIMGKNIEANFDTADHFWDKYPELKQGSYRIKYSVLDHEVNKETLCRNYVAKEKYGWEPKVSIETGMTNMVRETVKYLKSLEN